MLFSIVKDPTTSADELNHNIQNITEWARQEIGIQPWS